MKSIGFREIRLTNLDIMMKPSYYRYEISRKSMDKTDAHIIYIGGVTRMG